MRSDTVSLAVMLPRNVVFREWVTTFTTDTETVSEAQAIKFVRIVCEIDSRSELATNPEAERRFHELLRRPYVAWRDGRHRRTRQGHPTPPAARPALPLSQTLPTASAAR